MEHVKISHANGPQPGEGEILKLAAEVARGSPKASVMDIPVEELRKKVGSAYKLCNLAAKRAAELSEGALKLVLCASTKPTTIALAEIMAGKVKLKVEK